MNIIASFNEEQVSDAEAAQFRRRRSVRGVVYDADGTIALIHAENEGYHTLPGGGVESEETFEEGIIRECKEEVGCDVQIIEYIGTTLEYQKGNSLLKEVWGYTLKVVGNKGLPIVVDDDTEAERNSVVEWVTLADAIKLIESLLEVPDLYIRYTVKTDIAFLKSIEV
jgi:8-oxo-dGTP diphosphatase